MGTRDADSEHGPGRSRFGPRGVRQPEKFDPERGSLLAYLMAHAHGRSVDLMRSEYARRAREERVPDAPLATELVDPESNALALETAGVVRAALARLPAVERDAIEMAYSEGFTYIEVARRLNVAEGTTKSRIRIGLVRLRAELGALRLEDDR